MIVCKNCGFQNLDDDSFCGSCGGFLEWTGEAVKPAAPAEDDEEAAPAKQGFRSRLQTLMALDVHAPGEADHHAVKEDDAAGGGPPRPGGGPPRPAGGPPKPGGGPPRPGGGPPKPGGGPPRPGGGPPKPGGGPPTPGGGPPRPAGGPPKPSGGPPKPDDGPPTASDSSGDDTSESPDVAEVSTSAAALVADGATSTPPAEQQRVARSVAKKTVPTGERTIGESDEQVGAATPGATDAVKPQRPQDRPKVVKQKPTRKVLPGDLICGDCGEGNPAARKFCSRCGTSLVSAEIARASWWRRLLPKRRRKTLAAGERPWKTKDGKQKRSGKSAFFMKIYAKLRPIAAVMLLLAGLVYGFSPNIREQINGPVGDAKDSFFRWARPEYVSLAPIDVFATSEEVGNPAEDAVDSNPLTSWVAPGTDDEPTLVVTFDEPFDLERIRLWNGTADGFKDHERVSSIHFVFDTGQSFDLFVDDLPDQQDYEIENAQGVREVELHITETHTSLASTEVGLSEIEFFFKR